MWCPSDTWHRKHSSPRVRNLVTRLLIYEVPGGCTISRLRRFVFNNQQNSGYGSNCRNSSIYIPSSRLHLDSPFLSYWTHRQHPELSWHCVTCTKQPLSFQNTPDNLHNIVCSLWASFHYVQLYHDGNASDVDSFPTHMAANSSHKANGKAIVTAKMPTSVINRSRWFDWDRIKWFISELIRGLILIFNVSGVKDERAWDLFYDIICFDPVTTRHCSRFRPKWPHHMSTWSRFREWWAPFRSYMGQMFDTTRDQMNSWRWDNPRAFGDQVDPCKPQTTRWGKVNGTGEHFSWYGSDDLRIKIEPQSCWLYMPSDIMAVRALN